jgi:hypothetical protein
MCAQDCDSVVHGGRCYTLASADEHLFDPEAHGITPEWTCTSNYRGFTCKYEVAQGRLELTSLSVSVQTYEPPPLFGVRPTCWAGCLFCYGLHAPIPYTGALMLGDMYDGFGGWAWVPTPSRFQILHRLVFEEGRLVGAEDLSTDYGRIWQLPREKRMRAFKRWEKKKQQSGGKRGGLLP